MVSRNSIIIRDLLYAAIIVILLVFTKSTDLSVPVRVLLIAIGVASRVWQHVTYYKQTGKIY
jgi:hypothetical protein